MVVLEAPACLRTVNPAWERITGHPAADAPGQNLLQFFHPDDVKEAANLLVSLASSPSGEENTSVTARLRCQGGGSRWLHWNFSPIYTPEGCLLYATARDVTARKENEALQHWHINHDPLTGLPNRTLFRDRLRYLLAAAHRRGRQVAVLLVELDQFDRVQDKVGDMAGDALLRVITSRLLEVLHTEDNIARLAGERFAVALPDLRDSRQADEIAEKLIETLSAPLVAAGRKIRLAATVGIGLSPADGVTPEELLETADFSLRRARREARGDHPESPAALEIRRDQRMDLEADLSDALKRKEFMLHYQPQISLSTGKMIGVEALMRWQHADLGMVPPTAFIPIAEESGLIVPMGSWAFREACRQAADWQNEGYNLKVGVNLSARQLGDPTLPDRVAQVIRDMDIPPCSMNLELTESTLIGSDGGVALEVLTRLKALGVELAVDDFGTGYSSLSYLRRFPIDGVKIDRSFVTHITESRTDEAVVRAVIDLSHNLGWKVVAEGVENEAQRDQLLAMGCDTMQGYLFSAAVPPAEVPSLLAASQNS
jgi:diguanylate cyclase (GGDEF)-like protein/PAS domain S-box-containing protein